MSIDLLDQRLDVRKANGYGLLSTDIVKGLVGKG